MTRRHSGSDGEPFNANPNTGRMGFRYEWEPRDERPLLIYPYPFWESSLEQATYDAAVAMNPRRDDEGAFSYIRRISELVTQERELGVKTMPRPRMSRAAQDLRLQMLREQAGGKT